MTRRQGFLVATAILVSVVAIFIGWKLGQNKQAPIGVDPMNEPELAIVEGEALFVELYFPGPGGRLVPERRELPVPKTFGGHLQHVLDELLAGPTSENLFPALPPGFTVDWLHLNPRGVLYVDLKLGNEEPPPAWGSREEMLAVYSIVNTLLATTPKIKSVVLLRNGQQQPTFAGHLDTSRPLLANHDLVATVNP